MKSHGCSTSCLWVCPCNERGDIRWPAVLSAAASTRASASTLELTASGQSQIAEIYVPRLSLVRLPLKSVCRSDCGGV